MIGKLCVEPAGLRGSAEEPMRRGAGRRVRKFDGAPLAGDGGLGPWPGVRLSIVVVEVARFGLAVIDELERR